MGRGRWADVVLVKDWAKTAASEIAKKMFAQIGPHDITEMAHIIQNHCPFEKDVVYAPVHNHVMTMCGDCGHGVSLHRPGGRDCIIQSCRCKEYKANS